MDYTYLRWTDPIGFLFFLKILIVVEIIIPNAPPIKKVLVKSSFAKINNRTIAKRITLPIIMYTVFLEAKEQLTNIMLEIINIDNIDSIFF